jgi:hypothetical protein
MSDDEVLGELFDKFGLNDGDLPGSDDIQSRFSRHLEQHGFENGRVASLHNRRVASIPVRDRWLRTAPLSEEPPVWCLEDSDTGEEVDVPERLGEAIRQFLPLAAGLIALGRRLEAEWYGTSEEHRQGPATERDWPGCGDPLAMLAHLESSGWASERKLRLFACACCRSIGHLLPEAARDAVAVAERLADRQATEAERKAAYDRIEHEDSATAAAAEVCSAWRSREESFGAARDVIRHTAVARAFHHSFLTQDLVAEGKAVLSGEQAVQARLLRDIVGDPSRTPRVEPSWLAWNERTIPKLAQAAYDDRAFDRLPVLADALEEAGCDDAGMLSHLRGPGPHARGCFVLDSLLGKS